MPVSEHTPVSRTRLVDLSRPEELACLLDFTDYYHCVDWLVWIYLDDCAAIAVPRAVAVHPFESIAMIILGANVRDAVNRSGSPLLMRSKEK